MRAIIGKHKKNTEYCDQVTTQPNHGRHNNRIKMRTDQSATLERVKSEPNEISSGQ